MSETPTMPDASTEQIVARLKELCQEVIKPEDLKFVDFAQITAETPLLSLPMDSLALMALMTKIEETFLIYVPEDQAFAFQKLGDVVSYIQQKLAAKAQRAAAKAAQG